MPSWFLFAILSIIGLTGYRIALKVIGYETSPFVIMTICSFLYFCAWLAVCLLQSEPNLKEQFKVALSSKFLLIGILAASFFIADYFLLRSYMAGGKLSIMTVLLGLSMLTTVLVGFLAFNETLTWVQALGVVLGVASFAMLAAPERSNLNGGEESLRVQEGVE